MEGYESDLARFVSIFRSAVDRILIPSIPSILRSAEMLRPKPVLVDSVEDDMGNLLRSVSTAYETEASESAIEQVVRGRAYDINRFNRRDQGRVMAALIGIDPIGGEAWVAQEMGLFVRENVKLIKSIGTQARQKIETTVFEGARRGVRAADLVEEIHGAISASESRARLIARDQISKFNGDLTRLRQTEAGFPAYRWSTSHDARVRDSHAENEGKIFLWDDPPETGHPGEDYQCRCVAIPVTVEEYEQWMDKA